MRPRTPAAQVFLIFGRSGWIGGLVGELLKQQGAKFDYASARLEDRAAILKEIERVGAMCMCMRMRMCMGGSRGPLSRAR